MQAFIRSATGKITLFGVPAGNTPSTIALSVNPLGVTAGVCDKIAL